MDKEHASAPLIKCRQHQRLSSIDILTAYLMRAEKRFLTTFIYSRDYNNQVKHDEIQEV